MKRNRLAIELTNVKSVTIHAKRARVRCNAALDVTSDGPARIRLRGCGRVKHVEP